MLDEWPLAASGGYTIKAVKRDRDLKFYVTEQIRLQIAAAAAAENITISEWLSNHLEHHFRNHKVLKG